MKTRTHQPIVAFLVLTGALCAVSNARLQAASPAASSGSPGESAEVGAAPAVHTVTGQFTRVVVVRLKYDTDVLDGLKTAVAREKIQNAVILSGAGSLTGYHVHVVSNTTFPVTEAFIKEAGPFDLLTTTGYVIDGRVHAHITFANTQKTLGGHLEPGTKVFTFAVITLGVLDERSSLKSVDDANWR